MHLVGVEHHMFFQYQVSVYQISSTQLALAFLCKRKIIRKKVLQTIKKSKAASDLYAEQKE